MNTLRLAYFLIARPSALSSLRDDTCRSFPEHMTVRGRFTAPADVIADLSLLGRYAFSGCERMTIVLRGPVSPCRSLIWYEPDPHEASRIRDIHANLNSLLVRERLIACDEVPEAHAGREFWPHFTVSFRPQPASAVAEWAREVSVTFDEWGLYRYDVRGRVLAVTAVYGERFISHHTTPSLLKGLAVAKASENSSANSK
jgi:hypothetical protein